MTTTIGKAPLNAEVTKQARIIAYGNDYLLTMHVALAALPLALLLSKPGKAPGGARQWPLRRIDISGLRAECPGCEVYGL
jgi:hypothetical protein